jgi:hypothetical protein
MVAVPQLGSLSGPEATKPRGAVLVAKPERATRIAARPGGETGRPRAQAAEACSSRVGWKGSSERSPNAGLGYCEALVVWLRAPRMLVSIGESQ